MYIQSNPSARQHAKQMSSSECQRETSLYRIRDGSFHFYGTVIGRSTAPNKSKVTLNISFEKKIFHPYWEVINVELKEFDMLLEPAL